MTVTASRTGARALVQALRRNGIDMVFAVPGESYLAVLDALYDEREAVRLIVCRQEGGAAFMAEAYGKLTGRPGVCLVTRGPGACNAAIGVHVARQDSTPMLLVMGQVARPHLGREAFQEIDPPAVFGSMAKWAAQVDDPGRIPEAVSRAVHTALQGRPGPVVLAVPEDVLRADTAVPDPDAAVPARAHPDPAALARLGDALAAAERPVGIVGGGGWSAAARADLSAFAGAWRLPVATAFRRADYMDNEHPCYAGDLGLGPNPALAERVRRADLLLAVGARLGEVTTSGYALVAAPRPAQRLIHVHADPAELGRVYRPDVAVNADSGAFLAAARALPAPGVPPRWATETERARAEYLAWQAPQPGPGALQLGEIVAWLRDRLPADAIVCNGAGNYAGWLHRYYRYRGWRSQLAPTAGSMGYGVPAAVAAGLVHPERVVVSVNGDGCFLMNGQELATAVQYGVAIVVLVVDNGMYGTIRMHQERAYPGRVYGTALTNPDFAALARAHGALGETVARTAEFAPAFERALAARRPALLHLKLDPAALSHRTPAGEAE